MSFDDILHGDPSIVQLAGNGIPGPILDHVALNAADLGDAGDDGGAVKIAQTAFHVLVAEIAVADLVFLPYLAVQGAYIHGAEDFI